MKQISVINRNIHNQNQSNLQSKKKEKGEGVKRTGKILALKEEMEEQYQRI